MRTPQELKENEFKKVVFWGYDMNSVDSFIEDIREDYTQLFKENITLKNKLKFLVGKIEEYRSVEQQMQQALADAQRQADAVVAQAQEDSQRLAAQRQAEIEDMVAQCQEKITTEEMRLEEARTAAQSFIERMLAMYTKETALLREIGARECKAGDALADSAPLPETPVSAAAAAALDDTTPLPNVPPVPTEAEPVAPPEAQPAQEVYQVELDEEPRKSNRWEDDEETIRLTPKARFAFNNLQFGKDADEEDGRGKNRRRK